MMMEQLPLTIHFVIFILLTVSPSLLVRFKVIGPDHPLVVHPGEDVVLPCHLSPQINAEKITVRWFRDGKSQLLVHQFIDGQDWNDGQMEDYTRRTELLRHEFRIGNVPLKILNVRSSDTGQYTCYVKVGYFDEETLMDLKVAAMGSKPHLYLEESHEGGMQIVCTSSGWYPEPRALWEDGRGDNTSAATEVHTAGGTALFHIKTTYVINAPSNRFSCCIDNPALSQGRRSTIHISDSFLRSVSTCSSSHILIPTSLSTAGMGLISLAVYLFKRQRGQLLRKLGELSRTHGWTRAKRFAVQVTLDPDTANENLILSEGGRQLRRTDTDRPHPPIPHNPKRFTTGHAVMGKGGFSSGRHYWELQLLAQEGGWIVGVARESVSRSKSFTLSPEWGVWALELWNGNYVALLHPDRFTIPLSQPPRKLGLYLDYEGGRVSMCNAETMEEMYTFTGATFTEQIYPFFRIGNGTALRLL